MSGAGDVRDLERFHTDFHLLDARAKAPGQAGAAGRHGRDVRLELLAGATLKDAADPQRRPDPGNVAEAIAAGAALRGGQRQRHRELRPDTRTR